MNAFEYLNTFTNFETHLHKLSGKEFDLSRVKKLLEVLGNPQKGLKIIHVAGTKGKGSTCAFISYILAAAGYRVGLYTSPHLHNLNERVRVLDKNAICSTDEFFGAISDEELDTVIAELRGHIDGLVVQGMFFTYFEVITAAALYFFSRQNLDFVVLETGLGGRLDATNAVDSIMAVITPISLDHTNILGHSVSAIAREKAGIIKSLKQTVVIAPQSQDAMAIILQRCAEFGIAPVTIGPAQADGLKVALKGRHQQINAAVAAEAVKTLRSAGYKISDQAIALGLKNTRWPGRFEMACKNPTVILDGAHNAHSARALAKAMAEQYPGRRMVLVIGSSLDKDIASIIRELKECAQTIIFTRAQHPRAYVFDENTLGQWLPQKNWFLTNSVQEALDLALSKAKNRGVVVVAGSLFVVAQARDILKNVHVSV